METAQMSPNPTLSPCKTSTPLQRRARGLEPLQLRPFCHQAQPSPRLAIMNSFSSRPQTADDSAYDSMCDPLLPRSLLGTPKSATKPAMHLAHTQEARKREEVRAESADLLCGLCQCHYRDPRVLACFHSFCRECLEQHASGMTRVSCPACNGRTQLSAFGVEGLLSDYALLHAVKMHENKNGGSDGSASYFELEILKSGQKKCHCLEHRTRQLQYYCMSCNFAVCDECTAKEHRRPAHQLEPIEQAAEQQLGAIEKLIDEVNVKQTELSLAFREVESIQRRANTQLNQAHAKLQEAANCMMQAIQDASECMQKDLDATYVHRQEQIVQVSREVQKMTGKIYQTVKFAQRLMKYGHPTEILVFKPLLEARLRGFLNFNAETELILSGNMEIDQPHVEVGQIRQALNSLSFSIRPDTWLRADNCQPHPPSGALMNSALARNGSQHHLNHSNSHLNSNSQAGRLHSHSGNNNLVQQLTELNMGKMLADQARLNRTDPGSFVVQEGSPQNLTPNVLDSGLNTHLVNTYVSAPQRTAARREKMIYHHKFGEFGINEGQFTEPSGVTVTAANEIVVADTNNHRIQVFDRDGKFKFMFGECGKRDGQLLYPNRVAVNRITGEFVVTERSPTHQIQVFNQYGQFLRKFGASILQHPRGVCVDYQGRIIVVECKVMRVIVFDTYGNVLSKFSCSRYLEFPNAVCANDKDQLFISDNRAHCIKVFNYEGQFLHQVGGEGITNYPIGMGITSAGEVVVADNHNNFNLTVFGKDGQLISAMESRVKHAQCFDVALLEDNTVVLASKDYRLYLYRFHRPLKRVMDGAGDA